jgi:hypothetical protein
MTYNCILQHGTNSYVYGASNNSSNLRLQVQIRNTNCTQRPVKSQIFVWEYQLQPPNFSAEGAYIISTCRRYYLHLPISKQGYSHVNILYNKFRVIQPRAKRAELISLSSPGRTENFC